MKIFSTRWLTILMVVGILIFCMQQAFAQSGGPYQITQSVTASGEQSSSGTYSLEETGGQPVAGGLMQNTSYSVYSGFWTPPNFAPTAASVIIGGRVLTASGQGIRNTVITLTTSTGAFRTTLSSSFGYYSFTDVPTGETYIISIRSKNFAFSQPTQILTVFEEMNNLDFVAEN